MNGIWTGRSELSHIECLTSKGKKILRSYARSQPTQDRQQPQHKQQLLTPQHSYLMKEQDSGTAGESPKSHQVRLQNSTEVTDKMTTTGQTAAASNENGPNIPSSIKKTKEKILSKRGKEEPIGSNSNPRVPSMSLDPNRSAGLSGKLPREASHLPTSQIFPTMTRESCETPTCNAVNTSQSREDTSVQQRSSSHQPTTTAEITNTSSDEKLAQCSVQATISRATCSRSTVVQLGNEDDDEEVEMKGEEDKMILKSDKIEIRPKER